MRHNNVILEHVDRRLAMSFGAVVLLLMLIVSGTASYLFNKFNENEEARLSSAIAMVLSESISRISFSGKYQTRLLAEEMKSRVPELAYITVETFDGHVIADSDPAQNDTNRVDREDRALRDKSLTSGMAEMRDRLHKGKRIKEVVLPYRNGPGAEVIGVIRIGINSEQVYLEQRVILLKLLVIIIALTAAAIWVVLLISRHFGGTVRAFASQLQGILNHAPLGIGITDREGKLRTCSLEFEHLIGSPSAKQSITELYATKLSDSDVQQLAEPELDVFKSGVKSEQDLDLKLRDNVRTWHVSRFPIAQDKDQRPTLVCSFISDITERKQAEIALQNNQRMLRSILDTVPQSVFWKDINSVYLGCNQIFAHAVGLNSPDEINGKTDYDLPWPRSDIADYIADDQTVIASNAPKWHILEQIQQADGKRIWVETSKVPLHDENGTVFGVLGVYEDITERKLADEEKQHLEEQLRQAQKMEAVGRLAGGVAHDFNNMLQVINSYAEMVLNDMSHDNPLRDPIIEIAKAGKRSADLTRQLLAFARKQTIIPKVLNLNEIVSGMLNVIGRLIGEDIRLVWKPYSSPCFVKMDPTQIDQILANLSVNARDAITGVGNITIETDIVEFDEAYCLDNTGYQPGRYVLLLVSDDGCGMDKETQASLFEPFFTTKPQGHGTGLGLATVYGIVKQNAGFINVYSELGYGTTFKIYIPMVELDNVVIEESSKIIGRQFGKETILIVEDEEAVLTLTKALLARQGYSVLSANKPNRALQMAREHEGDIDLLITDVIMPEMTGRELWERFSVLRPKTKCIYMSGYTADIIAQHGEIEENLLILQKPFTTASLLAKIHEALAK